MKINKSLIGSSKFINLILASACLSLLAMGIWAPKASSNRRSMSQQQKKPLTKSEYEAMIENLDPSKIQIRNMTQALKVISIEKVEGGGLRLTLQNGYSKGINGIEISMVNVGIHDELGYNKENIIPPGGTYATDVPIQPHTDTDGIEIAAVIFEDGTADGKLAYVKQAQEQRLGERAQFKRALALIQSQLAEPDADTTEGLNRLESQLQSLPEREEPAKTANYEIGLKQAKQFMLKRIEYIRDQQSQSAQTSPYNHSSQQNVSIRAGLTSIINEFKEIFPK